MPAMTPYYDHAGITIYHGDCMEILPDLYERTGCIVTDPPYGIGMAYTNAFFDSADHLKERVALLKNESVALLQYPEEMMRFIVPILGVPDEVITWVYNSNLPRQTRLWGIWNCDVDFNRVKQKAKNPECKKVRSKLVKSYDWIGDIQQVKGNARCKQKHPCQIPVELVGRVVRLMAPTRVTDPFMGTGTTLLAARSIGIPSIGIEIEERYCEIAAKRLEQEVFAF